MRILLSASFKLLQTLQSHSKPVFSLVWSPDSKILASASGFEDRTIHLWRTADSTHLDSLEGHSIDIRSLAWSPDGKILASASADTMWLYL
jgi:WD40 repeat protein